MARSSAVPQSNASDSPRNVKLPLNTIFVCGAQSTLWFREPVVGNCNLELRLTTQDHIVSGLRPSSRSDASPTRDAPRREVRGARIPPPAFSSLHTMPTKSTTTNPPRSETPLAPSPELHVTDFWSLERIGWAYQGDRFPRVTDRKMAALRPHHRHRP